MRYLIFIFVIGGVRNFDSKKKIQEKSCKEKRGFDIYNTLIEIYLIGAGIGIFVSWVNMIYLNLISHVSCVDLCIYRLWIWKGVKRTYTRLSKSYLILLSADNVITKIPIKTHGTIEYRLTGSTYNFSLNNNNRIQDLF